MLNVKDAFARVERAKEQHRELGEAWRQWNENGGIQGCVQQSGVRVGPDQRYRRVVAE